VSYYTVEVDAIDMMQARELVEEMGPSAIADDGYYTGWDYLEFKVDYADEEEVAYRAAAARIVAREEGN
jgi:hypothetical protein